MWLVGANDEPLLGYCSNGMYLNILGVHTRRHGYFTKTFIQFYFTLVQIIAIQHIIGCIIKIIGLEEEALGLVPVWRKCVDHLLYSLINCKLIIIQMDPHPQQPHTQQQITNHKQDTNNKTNLLIGVTGSVAAIKLQLLITELSPYFNIKVIVTQYAKKFMWTQQFPIEKYRNILYYDQMEWQMWKGRGDPVLHIQLRKWAKCLLIAPLSANTLAKLSNGLCDNLLTLVCRAWSMEKEEQSKQSGVKLKNPIIICPSMNTMMWDHPVTQTQINILKSWGYQMFGPISKKMMCGDIGNGAMSEVPDIIHHLLQRLNIKKQVKQ